MAKKITVSDPMVHTVVILHGNGSMEVEKSGGCAVETILGVLDPASPSLEADIRAEWADGYDGDMADVVVAIEEVDSHAKQSTEEHGSRG